MVARKCAKVIIPTDESSVHDGAAHARLADRLDWRRVTRQRQWLRNIGAAIAIAVRKWAGNGAFGVVQVVGRVAMWLVGLPCDDEHRDEQHLGVFYDVNNVTRTWQDRGNNDVAITLQERGNGVPTTWQ